MAHKKDAADVTTAPLSALGVTKGWVLTTFKRDRLQTVLDSGLRYGGDQ